MVVAGVCEQARWHLRTFEICLYVSLIRLDPFLIFYFLNFCDVYYLKEPLFIVFNYCLLSFHVLSHAISYSVCTLVMETVSELHLTQFLHTAVQCLSLAGVQTSVLGFTHI